jgi:thiamine-monophosphate kinase
MKLSALGEFGLIERIKRSIPASPSVKKGIGDDCAVIKLRNDNYLLLTCDMIVEGVDFTSRDKPRLIGRKALAVSLSDIAACAGVPRYALVSLGIKKDASVAYVDQILKGITQIAKEFKVDIVGGDISRARDLTIDVSMVGEVEKKYLALRNGAKVGDGVFVTGSLGGSRYGRHLTFLPRVEEARFLARNFKVHAMIDVSDGLLQDLGHILKESKVGVVLYERSIPVHAQARSFKEALSMGEDFELLFTVARKEIAELTKKVSWVTPIGHIVEKKFGLKMVDGSCRPRDIDPRGFRHF